jgi:tripartite-type tricarboxylate transporter receptor subunit TctC
MIRPTTRSTWHGVRARAALAVFAALTAATSMAQNYPARPVRMVVPFTPGGSTDIIGRVVAQKLGEAWGTQVIVDNRPGAGGNIGVEIVAKSPPDGYTLLVGHIGTMAVNPSLYPKLAYDPLRDFVPISLAAYVHNMLAVHPSLPAKTVKDVIALARAKPGALNYGSGGSGSAAHLSVEYFKLAAKIDVQHIPYKGTAPMLTDLIGGQLSLTITGVPPLLAQVKAGKLRGIAVAAAKRLPLLPDLPTMAETVPGYESTQWYGILAPAGTPKEIVAKINADIARGMKQPETAQRLSGEGADPFGGPSEQFGAHIKAEIERWGKVIRASGARPD